MICSTFFPFIRGAIILFLGCVRAHEQATLVRAGLKGGAIFPWYLSQDGTNVFSFKKEMPYVPKNTT